MTKQLPAREEIRCTTKQKQQWEKAAKLVGLDRSQWERLTLDKESAMILSVHVPR